VVVRDIVCLSHLRWDFVYQRPQHLMTRCARDARVWYVEEPTFGDGPWEPLVADAPRLDVSLKEGGVKVAVPRLPDDLAPADVERIQSELLTALLEENAVSNYALWFYTPMPVAWTRRLRPRVTVYDCMDELANFVGAPRELLARERELLARADVVFTGGQSLYEAKRDRHANVHVFPSAVDADHFRAAREGLPDPDDQGGLGRPRLGFYGVLDERMDFGLLAAVARARPQWQLVIVGPAVPKFASEDLAREPNIHYLGGKTYDELPAYVAGWDVALIPFARNRATEFVSPTKTPEYLAAGKPVVSTPIRDVVRPWGDEGLVHVAGTPEEFVGAVERALAEDGAERRGRVDARLAELSWDRTWAQMRTLVAAAAGRRTSASVRPLERFDWMVVGAGFAGSVLAERLAGAGASVLLVDRRAHLAGNAFDHYDEAGILVHRYGPHIFHTNSDRVVTYLSRFTAWRPYEHRVRASVDGKLLPIPINLDTVNGLYGLDLSPDELVEFFAARAEPVNRARTSEDVVVAAVGRELYETFFRGYTRKQWGLDPSELDASVTARVPTRTNQDDRYFTDSWQAMPRDGFTRMFERMVAHSRIKLLLGTDYREIEGLVPYGRMVFTGPVDEFFDSCYGTLPYRSLEFRHETHERPRFQAAPVVNYPNEHDYTRVTEFKYLTGQEHTKTSVVYEYPKAEGDPYYPVPRPENALLYRAYKELADARPDVEFVGRLATYKYYNMDQVVAQALAVFDRITGKRRQEDGDAAAPSGAARALGRPRVHGQPGS
jgi:UDP-galactopyranose mutase